MPRLGFGAFLAPHHPVGENPLLQFRRDLDLVEHLDKLGYDEFWCGEHHSSGWEMIGSPEMFLAAAGETEKSIKVAPGGGLAPHHHPLYLAPRMGEPVHKNRCTGDFRARPRGRAAGGPTPSTASE